MLLMVYVYLGYNKEAPEDCVFLKKEVISSQEEIELAYYLAKKSFSNNPISKQFKYEFLLWVTGKRDIESALKLTDSKEQGYVVSFNRLLQLEEARLPKEAGPLAIERISLSRI